MTTAFLADLPSLLFLLALAANTAVIVTAHTAWLLAPALLLQALMLIGLQEAKHQCVHRNFLRHRGANDLAGMVCAAFAGLNFTVYRHFHLQHHRALCTARDPESRLYRLSWRTRWIWLLAPLEVPWVAWHIHRTAWPMVPASQHGARSLSTIVMLAVAAPMAVLAWRHPKAMAWALAAPMVLSSWIGFLLTQAEHYGAPVAPDGSAIDPARLTHDLVLPWHLGWFTLHASLHRVHHCAPATRWFQATARLKADTGSRPLTLAGFAKHWLARGPRLWPAEGHR